MLTPNGRAKRSLTIQYVTFISPHCKWSFIEHHFGVPSHAAHECTCITKLSARWSLFKLLYWSELRGKKINAHLTSHSDMIADMLRKMRYLRQLNLRFRAISREFQQRLSVIDTEKDFIGAYERLKSFSWTKEEEFNRDYSPGISRRQRAIRAVLKVALSYRRRHFMSGTSFSFRRHVCSGRGNLLARTEARILVRLNSTTAALYINCTDGKNTPKSD